MESADALEGRKGGESLPFQIGTFVQQSHGLKGADVGVVLTYDHQNLADPLENTHVIVGGVVLFGVGTHTLLPDDEYQSWPMRLVKEAEEKYKTQYSKLRPTSNERRKTYPGNSEIDPR